MLTFKVSTDGAKTCRAGLAHAHVLGADGLPLTARLETDDNAITVHADEPTSLCVLFDAGACGVLALRTTLLTPRQRPRSLTVELARRSAMLIAAKLEDWVAWDASPDHPVIAEYQVARDTLVEAIAIGDEAAPDGDARREELGGLALRQSIRCGERLALWAADRLLAQRAAAGSAAQLGCAVAIPSMSAPGVDLAAQRFDFVHCPLRWPELAPSADARELAGADRWIEWAVRILRKPVAAGPLIDLRAGRAPEWLQSRIGDYPALREAAFEHVRAVVARYRRYVQRWNVASGLHLNDWGALTLEQIMDLTRVCVSAAKKEAPGSEVLVEIAEPFGGAYARNAASLPPSLYAEMLAQQGVSIDAIALRIESGAHAPGCAVRDLLTFSDLLDRYSQFDKPIEISSLGAPSDRGDEVDSLASGHWRTEWCEAAQAEWLTAAMAVSLSKPFVRAVCLHTLVDPEAAAPAAEAMRAGGLLRGDGGAKPSMDRVRQLRSLIRARKPASSLLAPPAEER